MQDFEILMTEFEEIIDSHEGINIIFVNQWSIILALCFFYSWIHSHSFVRHASENMLFCHRKKEKLNLSVFFFLL